MALQKSGDLYVWPQISAVVLMLVFAASGFAQSPLTGTAQNAFTFVDRGGALLAMDGSVPNLGVGYASAQIITGNIIPAGVAVIGLRTNGALVSEVGVPVSPVLRKARIFTEVGATINTGVAIANPSNKDATVSFFFTDSAGVDSLSGSMVIPAWGQISQFVDQPPFNSPSTFLGTFSFSSDSPVAAIALRGLINERHEFLMSSLPVVDLDAPSSSSVTLPHFADGGGWSTQIILINPTDLPVSGTIGLVGQSGSTVSTFPFSLPKRSSFRQRTPGVSASIQSGSVRIVTSGSPLAAVAIFSYKPADVTVSEGAVGSVSGTALRMYTESGVPGAPLAKQSGVAVANLSGSATTVTFELSTLEGKSVATTSLSLPVGGQTAQFLGDIFTNTSPFPAAGILRVTAPAPGVSVVGLRGRYNERGDFLLTTTPPFVEVDPTSERSTQYVFPEVANGGGYSTEFLMLGRSNGLSTNGKIRYSNQDGTLPLSLNCPVPSTSTSTPEVIRQILPQYSDAARQAKITGTVILQSVVHEDGSISVTGFLKSVGYGLDENAQNAVQQWRFCPATLNGRAVSTVLTIQVSFNLL